MISVQPMAMQRNALFETCLRYSLLVCLVAVLGSGCGIRGYHFAAGTGDITHSPEPGARVVVPNRLLDHPPQTPAFPAPVCDPVVWGHVYHPQRLKVLNNCVTVTGTVVDATHGRRKDGQRHEADADNHGWLRVDPEYKSVLLPGNQSAEAGNLVFECVCQYGTPKQADAVDSCKGYASKVKVPPVGSHVAITGSLVTDLQHQPLHNEIHPVSSITVLPK